MYEQFSKQGICKKLFNTVIVAAFGLCLWFVGPYSRGNNSNLTAVGALQQVATVEQHKPLEQTIVAPEDKPLPTALPDFTYAAKVATRAVVHVKIYKNPKLLKQGSNHPLEQFFKEFFGERLLVPKTSERPPEDSYGSGVIYTSNGYIITNNHVVEGADQIEVILNDNRSYKAKLVGSDACTDLAILKIEASDLPVLALGSSDKLEVGEWVLAVGNPFNLHSTVTKGIVSAKSRWLDHVGNGQLGIQSFIQTDAAINPGNSGGALVNLYGELVGINTAICPGRSSSLTFIGYGFAIPSSIVKKVANDFIQHGAIQRVLLGITIRDVDAALAQKLGLQAISGVYVDGVQDNSPCGKEFQKEDVITQINGRKVNKCPDLQEIICCAKPGDKVAITLYRKGKVKTIEIVLKKQPDVIQIVQQDDILKVEGAVFQNIDKKTKAKLKLTNGVLVQEVSKGKFQDAGLKKGYILLAFDKQPVASIADLAEMIRRTREPVLMQVMEPSKGTIGYLAVQLGSTPHAKQ
ncbi:Do family serine endopeptidase [Cardinium endosymbiont of Philonthus spinipes]|uniref:Do family serine endopeptidase n=1 Tax=Cardinium endosymbiont of Philonthus spinipes TaxID=3077941 RepID=UPI00313D7450